MQFVECAVALATLTAMEIVLGIDNLVFIAILADRLPKERQAFARRLGLAVALWTRLLLLFAIKWLIGLNEPLWEWTSFGLPRGLFPDDELGFTEANGVSWRDIVLLVGGMFLVGKSVLEIHAKMEGAEHGRTPTAPAKLHRVIAEIAVMDLVFSLDSVITAVGMARDLWVMVVAVILAVAAMLLFADQVSRFIERHPTLKMLALSFLLLIGVMLVAEAIGTHINKGYIYFAMAFSLMVEFLNIRSSSNAAREPVRREE